jgi:predicted nicotinamide N-methyase
VALARELSSHSLDEVRVVELGCGLAVPSLAAARAGAIVLATDSDPVALELAERNAHANGLRIETARVEWDSPELLLERAPYDLVIAADVLYERQSVGTLLSLLPKLAPEGRIADPGRPAAASFMDQAEERWQVETSWSGVVSISRIRLGSPVAR